MKLSSAFDQSLLLSGCTGKTSPMTGEVAAVTGTQMAYLDKTNEMKTIQNSGEIPDVQFNGVFSLSDESGVNTIAYGGSGTVYGCFNYSNENIASYSKSYQGSSIFSSAFAVAGGSSAQAEASRPDLAGAQISSPVGIMLGVTSEAIHAYSTGSSEGGTWNRLFFDPEGRIGTESANLDEAQYYYVKSAGDRFFVGTSRGIATFLASGINLTSSKISGWEILNGIDGMPETTDEVRSVDFAREISLAFPETTVGAYAMSYWRGAKEIVALIAPKSIDNGWNCTALEWQGTGTCTDAECISEATFQELVYTKEHSLSDYPLNEDIPWIDSDWISIRPQSKVGGEWTVVDLGRTQNAPIVVDDLKLKMPDGYAVLAKGAASSGNPLVADAPEGLNDSAVPALYAKVERQDGNFWKYTAAEGILQSEMPLPSTLDNGRLYKVIGQSRSWPTRWVQDYVCTRGEGETPSDAAIDACLPSVPDWQCPEDAVQLYQEALADAVHPNEAVLSIEVGSWISGTMSSSYTPYRIYVGIAKDVEEFSEGTYVSNSVRYKSGSTYLKYWTLSNGVWTQAGASSADNPIAGMMDVNSDGTGRQFYACIPIDIGSTSISSVDFGYGAGTVDDGISRCLNAAASYDADSGVVTVAIRPAASGYDLNIFDKTAKIKIVAEGRRSYFYSTYFYTKISPTGYVRDSSDPSRWTAFYSSSGSDSNPSAVTQRVIYSSSGIVSEADGVLKGDRIEARLAFANGSGYWKYAISARDASLLSRLTGRGLQGGKELLCGVSASIQGAERTGRYAVGTALLSENGVLSFSKTDKDGRPSHQVPAEAADANGWFVPECKTQSGTYQQFNCSLGWSREQTVGSASVSASGRITLSVPMACAADSASWTSEWTMQFQDMPEMPAYAEGCHMFLDSRAHLCTDASAAAEEPLEVLDIKGMNLLRYGFRDGSSGALALLSLRNGNAAADIVRFVHLDEASNGRCLVCGPTAMWSVDPDVDGGIMNSHVNSVENQMQCLSFRMESGGDSSDALYQITAVQVDDADVYLARECRIAVGTDEYGPRPYLSIEGSILDSLDGIPPERAFSGTISDKMPVWIDGNLYWLELVEDDNGLEATVHPLHWDGEEGQPEGYSMPSALAVWNEGPVRHLSIAEISAMTAQNPSHLPLQFGENLGCLARFRLRTPETSGGLLEWKWEADCLVYGGSDEWIQIGDKWMQYFSDSDAWRTEALSVTEGSQIGFSFKKARSEGALLDALSNVCIRSGDSWKMLERGSGGDRFSPIAFYVSIPELQRSQIGQLYFDPSNVRRIIRYEGAASSLDYQRWTLYEQAPDSSSDQGWTWSEWPSNMYDSTKVYSVNAAGGWPQFNPVHGAVYYARTNHTTGDSNRYSSGYYVYVADGSSLGQAYRKLPYLVEGESGDTGWRSWIGNDSLTCLVLVGRGALGGEGCAASLRLLDGWPVQDLTFGENGWLSFGPFKWTSGIAAVPALKSRIALAADALSQERPVYACFSVPVDDGSPLGRTAMIAVKKSLSFNTPRIVGLFQNEDGTEADLAASDPLDAVGAPRGTAVSIRHADIGLNGAQFVSMSIRDAGIQNAEMNWVWEAALNALKTGGVYAVGAYGTLNLSLQNGTPKASGTAAFIYSNAVKTSTDNAAGVLPHIHSPEANASADSAESDIVLWNDEGFYVSLKRHSVSEASSEPVELEGSSSLAEKHAIVEMTAFKAYNAPIILGLYEKSGLILYYGRKCFDQSILSERIRDFDAAQDAENSIGSHMLEAARSIVGDDPYELSYGTAGRADIPEFVRSWMPDTETAVRNVVSILASGLSASSRNKIAQSIFRKTAMSSPTAAERNGWNAVANACAERQTKERMMEDLDCRLAQSYEYSPNNSSESQWVDIPIIVKRTQGAETVYEEPSESLTTLTTSAVNGRIRVSVGSSTGNVYWRDLNPLHADKFISYIPTSLLAPAEQNEIASAGVRPGNERLREFILGRGAGSEGTEARVAWTQEQWQYTGADPIANQNFFAAERGSKASIAKGTDMFLSVDGTKTGIQITHAEAKNIADSAKYDPYVYVHNRNWIIGGADTGIPVYANAPVAKMTGGKLVWFADGVSTGVQAKKNVYPAPSTFQNRLVWGIGETPTSAVVRQNGVPYVQDGVWMVQEADKAAPTSTGILDTGQGAAAMGGWIDTWRIHPSNTSEGRDIGVSTETAKSASTKFGTYQKTYWALSNVTQIGDNGAPIGELVEKYITKHEAKDGETAASCPYVLKPAKKLAIGTFDNPQWSSKGTGYAGCSYIMVNAAGRIDAVDAPSGLPTAFASTGCCLGSSGREFWVLPSGTSGPWCEDAQPSSTIGTRWRFTKIDGSSSQTWDSIQKVSGKWKSWNVPQNAVPAANSAGNWHIGNAVPTDSNGNPFKKSQWQKPTCVQSIWLWTVGSNDAYSLLTASSECPYSKAMEICAWSSDNAVLANVDAGDDPVLKRDFSASRKNWLVNGQDTGIPVKSGDSPQARVSWSTAGECTFQWSVLPAGENSRVVVAETASPDCPVTAGSGMTWWIQNGGKWRDTKIAAGAGIYSKGLESDGIAAMPMQRTVWNPATRAWESTPVERTSWTPLASLFIDAYEETSRGVISSIRNPYVRYEGRYWECISSESLFDEEDVHITDSKTTSWDAYQESANGNSTNPSFTIYVGWKEVPNSELFDSFCTIVSDTTGSMVKWAVREKEWKLLHCEAVTDSSGMLTNIVLMASRGWVVSTSIISFENKGQDIKTIVWQNALNPVQEVLQELEKIVAYQWNSWTSNTGAEFAAVGSYGVYVYSPDCIHFEASLPYGENAKLEEIVWDESGSEFKINGTAPTFSEDEDGGGESKTMTVEYAADTSGEIAFEDEYKNAASEGGGGLATAGGVGAGIGSGGSSSGGTGSGSGTGGSASGSSSSGSSSSGDKPGSGKTVTISTTDVQPLVFYKHSHKTYANESETLYYAFNSSVTSFTQMEVANLSASDKSEARSIVPDTSYKFTSNGRIWLFTYSKVDSKGNVLGSGYSGKTNWSWKWTRQEDTSAAAASLSYITISKNTKDVAYGFPDLIRFIRSYKKTYREAMEFMGGVSTFISSERESVDNDRKALMESYVELAEMGDSGLKMYSENLMTAYKLYLQAKKYRDDSHYAQNDCWDTWLQKIGMSLALEHQDFFNRAKKAMWTAQAFRNHYEKLAKKGGKR